MAPPLPAPRSRTVGRARLLELAGDDPWVRWGLGDPLPGDARVHEGVAVVQRLGHRPGLWVAPLRPDGPADALPTGRGLDEEGRRVAAALRLVRDEGLLEVWGARSASLPAEHAAVGRALLPLTDEGGDWEWMWTTALPARDPREGLLVCLDDHADARELRRFAHTHNPRVWTRIGEGTVTRWVGVRDERGALVAVGGAEREDSGVPHLAGILTAGHARGQGWGQVVSAALTRWAVERHGVCTLGMFSDNDTARRLYRRLGYRTARRWCSRHLRTG
jgi:ribosomal protein S18 acetylase RimI-like enzyme